MTDEQHLVRAATAATQTANSRIDDLSDATGLDRLAFSMLELAPGDWATVSCDADTEAFLYVRNGQGRIHSASTDITFASGDFVAFRSPPAQRTVSNTGADLLVCLLGGESTTAVMSSPSEQ